jgi:ABC-type Zn2+ transport system substrate-binding protein/surface adhesin
VYDLLTMTFLLWYCTYYNDDIVTLISHVCSRKNIDKILNLKNPQNQENLDQQQKQDSGVDQQNTEVPSDMYLTHTHTHTHTHTNSHIHTHSLLALSHMSSLLLTIIFILILSTNTYEILKKKMEANRILIQQLEIEKQNGDSLVNSLSLQYSQVLIKVFVIFDSLKFYWNKFFQFNFANFHSQLLISIVSY